MAPQGRGLDSEGFHHTTENGTQCKTYELFTSDFPFNIFGPGLLTETRESG